MTEIFALKHLQGSLKHKGCNIKDLYKLCIDKNIVINACMKNSVISL